MGAYVLNLARGPLVDANACSMRWMRASWPAGLDVFEPEPVAVDSRLRNERIIATPHIAGVTADGRTRMEQMAVERVLAFFRGERPENVVNPEVYAGE
ncbi:MAG: NAD(P)-dependent oxidoreductase [Caldilineaceae bacterium]